MKTYEASLWPNNQSPILVGYIKAKNKTEAKKKICEKHDISKSDSNLCIMVNSPNTPLKCWQKI